MKTTKLPLLLVLLLTIASCNNKPSNATKDSTEDDGMVQSETTKNSKGKYALKSGIVEYKTQMMGMDAKQTLTFDDYGNLEIQEVEMEMMGIKIKTAAITKDGYVYNLNMNDKTGTKALINNRLTGAIDFENLSEQMMKEMDLKKLGHEEFLGKNCEKMSIDYKSMRMKGIYLIYKGLPLSMDVNAGSTKMNLMATKFVENPTVPASKFDIPTDFTITE